MPNADVLIKRLSYELKRNAPFGLMALAVVFILIVGFVDLRFDTLEFAKYTIALFVFAAGAVAAIVDYLELKGGGETGLRDFKIDQLSKDMLALKAEFGDTFGDFLQRRLPDQDAREMKTRFLEFLEKRAAASLSAELLNKLSVDNAKRFHLEQIRGINDGMIARLSKEIENLGRRADFNLAIGAVVCLTGFAVLGYYVFVERHNYEGNSEIIIETAIRLSLVLFIEIFAYFFLNLYRYGLFEIKYFQNEITNANFRTMALETALVKSDTPTLKKICEDMAHTERNFVLKKNETTLDLKRTELYMQKERGMSALFEKILAILSKDKGGH
jgi:hypothetical protein